MVGMAVRDKHQVNMIDALVLIRAGRIALRPGIDQYDFSLWRGDLECGVSKPGNLHPVHLHLVMWHKLFLPENTVTNVLDLAFTPAHLKDNEGVSPPLVRIYQRQ